MAKIFVPEGNDEWAGGGGAHKTLFGKKGNRGFGLNVFFQYVNNTKICFRNIEPSQIAFFLHSFQINVILPLFINCSHVNCLHDRQNLLFKLTLCFIGLFMRVFLAGNGLIFGEYLLFSYPFLSLSLTEEEFPQCAGPGPNLNPGLT